jgi:hypothetical protein
MRVDPAPAAIPGAAAPGRPSRYGARRKTAGVLASSTTTIRLLRFAAWAAEQGGLPDIAQIRAQFGVGRSTAQRWRALWAEATGQVTRRTKPRQAAPVDARDARGGHSINTDTSEDDRMK